MVNMIASGSSNLMDSAAYRRWAYIAAQAKQAQYSVPPTPTKSLSNTNDVANRPYSSSIQAQSNDVARNNNISVTNNAAQVASNVLGNHPLSTQDFVSQLQQSKDFSPQSNASAAQIGNAQLHNSILTSFAVAYSGVPSAVGSFMNRLV